MGSEKELKKLPEKKSCLEEDLREGKNLVFLMKKIINSNFFNYYL